MLALALGGRTIGEWQRAMTQAEFASWIEFYRLAPFDDLHRFHRPAALVSQSLGGGDLAARLEWLQPQPEADHDMSDADRNTLRAFGIKR